jgi:hypothetical protein
VPRLDDPVALDHADAEAGQVIVVVGVHAGHLGGLAAAQRATGELAAPGDPTDHRRRAVDVEAAAGVVVEEEQRLGAGHRDVVRAHRDEVDADGVVPVELLRNPQLGPDPVGARDQHRVAVAVQRQLEERPEAAEARHHPRPEGGGGERLDAVDQAVAGVDVDAGVAVGE